MKLRARKKSKKNIKLEKDSSFSDDSLISSEQISSDSEDVMEIEEVQKPIKKIRKEVVLQKSKQTKAKKKKKDTNNIKSKFFEEEASEKESESDFEPDGEDEKYDKEEFKQIELPNLSDPKLFAVRCIPGKEKQFLVRILDQIGFGSNNAQYSIQSVNVIDKFQGFIFFEAYKEFHNIPGVFRQLTLIPLSEVPQIFTVDETHRLKLQKNQFVRIKSGIYKDDLAQIISWETEQQSVIAKVVPRINYSNQNELKRPQKQLLKLSELTNYEEKRDRDNQVYIIFKGKRFTNGLLIKRFAMTQIETINVIPTIDEASQFLTSAEDEETQIKLMEELLSQINNSQQVSRQFAKGDKVKVISGELQNLIGSVISQSGNQVQVSPAFLGMNKDILNFHSSEIQKFFVEGDSVQFLQGKFKQCEGKITSVEGEIVTVYLFEEQKYVNGLLANVQLVGINQVIGEQTKQTRQDLRKFDLIRSLIDRKPCVVLRIVNHFITAINENNDLVSLNIMQVDEKLNNFKAVYLNKYHQKLTVDSSVRVVTGLNSECDDKIARVELQAQYRIVGIPIKYILEDSYDPLDDMGQQQQQQSQFGFQQDQQQPTQQWGAILDQDNNNDAGLTWGNNDNNNSNKESQAPAWGDNPQAQDNQQNEGGGNEWGQPVHDEGKKEEHWGEAQQEQQQQQEEASTW